MARLNHVRTRTSKFPARPAGPLRSFTKENEGKSGDFGQEGVEKNPVKTEKKIDFILQKGQDMKFSL
jgi:hypothetical protein